MKQSLPLYAQTAASSLIRIIGVDPSLSDSGLCVLENTQILKTAHLTTRASQEMPQRLDRIYHFFEEFFETAQASYLAIEDQFLGSFYSAKSYGLTERKNLKTIQGLSYVKGLALALAGKYQISVIQVNVSQWRTRFLPRRNMSKSEILKYINHLFQQNITNHNISDAILVGLCGHSLLRESQTITDSQSSSSTSNRLMKRPLT